VQHSRPKWEIWMKLHIHVEENCTTQFFFIFVNFHYYYFWNGRRDIFLVVLFRVHKLVVKIIYVPRTHSADRLLPAIVFLPLFCSIQVVNTGRAGEEIKIPENQFERRTKTEKRKYQKLAIINQSEESYIQEMNKNGFELKKENKTNKWRQIENKRLGWNCVEQTIFFQTPRKQQNFHRKRIRNSIPPRQEIYSPNSYPKKTHFCSLVEHAINFQKNSSKGDGQYFLVEKSFN